jgi:glucose/arabinose dehydrogenase
MRTLIALAAVAALAACQQEAKVEDTDDTAITDPAPMAPPPTVITITEADARGQIEAQGYTNVTGLMQNPDGSWSATATREGATTQVSVGSNGVTVVTAPAPTP